jgi:hypothetical protein
VIDGGRTLQPVLYALALGSFPGAAVDSGRLYYCTSAGGFAERSVALDDAARDAAATVRRRCDALAGRSCPRRRTRACR